MRKKIEKTQTWLEAQYERLKQAVFVFFNGDQAKVQMKSSEELEQDRKRLHLLLNFMKTGEEKFQAQKQAYQPQHSDFDRTKHEIQRSNLKQKLKTSLDIVDKGFV